MTKKQPKAIHYPISVPLFTEKMGKDGIEIWCPWSLKERFTRLKRDLKKLLKHPKICRNCGAINVDLVLEDEERQYYFTCWKVVDNEGKLLAETDYKRFSEYCGKLT